MNNQNLYFLCGCLVEVCECTLIDDVNIFGHLHRFLDPPILVLPPTDGERNGAGFFMAVAPLTAKWDNLMVMYPTHPHQLYPTSHSF